jgi:hypothetical protein
MKPDSDNSSGPQTARLATTLSLDALTRGDSTDNSRSRIDPLMDEIMIHEFNAGV